VDSIKLPDAGRKIAQGETLFSLMYGDYSLDIPSPISGHVISVNAEHAEHPEWLSIKPFELSWMCRIEPTNLADELSDLRIGHDAVDWYQEELDRYSQLARNGGGDAAAVALAEPEDERPGSDEETLKILARFSEPFLQH
jgi:hypothetical protein